jgi:sulfur-carrier protein
VATVHLPAMLAAEAGGQKQFDVDGGTIGEALRELPMQKLLFDEAGELRRLINVYVDGVDARSGRGLDEPVTETSEIRVVGAVAGG